MIDELLEKKISSLQDFIKLWVDFKNFLEEREGKESLSPEEEREFLEIKSRIARQYQGLVDTLKEDLRGEESIISILSHAPNLKQLVADSGMQLRKIKNDWHESFIFLNTVLGRLENRRRELASVSRFKILLPRIVKNPLFILIVIIVCLLLVYKALTILGVGEGVTSLPESTQEEVSK